MKAVALDKIVQRVVQEVVRELKAQGVTVVHAGSGKDTQTSIQTTAGYRTKIQTVDMGRFKSPVLTEGQIRRLHELTGEIVVPKKTVITPKARQLIRQQNLQIRYTEDE